MNEDEVRRTLLVRAWETAARDSVQWTDEDRAWASRTAAGIEGDGAPAEAFVARRAQLAAERIAERDGNAARALRLSTWRPWITPAAIVLALILGIATDAIGDGQRINVLAPPLLGVMLWNLAVYLAIALRPLLSRMKRRAAEPPAANSAAAASAADRHHALSGPIARLLARVGHRPDALVRRGRGEPGTAPVQRFAQDWAHASAGLNSIRSARILHLAAIGFALGALAGMYLRGLGYEYRAGWESTFLDASAVERLLTFVLGPASVVTGIALPDAARLEAMRFPGASGEVAGPWIHLYAVTIALVVLVPRAGLALRAWWLERRLAANLPLDLRTAYFTSLWRGLRGETATVRIVPYRRAPSSDAQERLQEALAIALDAPVRAEFAPVIAYGDEDEASAPFAADSEAALLIAVFSATATPEGEHQGTLLDALHTAVGAATPILALIDESEFVTRFGDDDAARRRLDERRSAWRKLLAAHPAEATWLDLERVDLDHASRVLREAFDRSNTLSGRTASARARSSAGAPPGRIGLPARADASPDRSAESRERPASPPGRTVSPIPPHTSGNRP